jgi:hypothetical protein
MARKLIAVGFVHSGGPHNMSLQLSPMVHL